MQTDQLNKLYQDDNAKGYDQGRENAPKWKAEHKSLESVLSTIPENLKLLDVPVGTGRFFDIYQKRGLEVDGVDISDDMMEVARRHPQAESLKLKMSQGDILNLKFDDGHFDITLCIRLLNLIDAPTVAKAVKELSRTSSQYVVVGIRSYVPIGKFGWPGFGALKMLARQFRLRRSVKKGGKIIPHSEKEVDSFFRDAGLSVKLEECIEKCRTRRHEVQFLPARKINFVHYTTLSLDQILRDGRLVLGEHELENVCRGDCGSPDDESGKTEPERHPRRPTRETVRMR